MFCRKCGTKNPDDARFCRNCGTPMSSGPSVNGGGSVNGGQNGNPTPPPMGQPGAMPRKPKGKRNGAMIAIVAVVVVALIASAVFFTRVIGIGGRSYEDTIEDMVDAMNDADIEAFFDLIPKEVVVYALEQEGLEAGRKAVSMIVGRDTQRLDETGVIKAAVETVAENTSDGVIAPLIFMGIFGAVGGFFYKSINTMDSMIGYKNEKYQYFGTVAAKLDDIVNFIPARISAIIMIVSAFLCGMNGKEAFRIFKRDRYNHASPNSAQTESVMAGALGVQLAGDAWYFGVKHDKPTIGDAKRPVELRDIQRSNRLMYTTTILTAIIIMAIRLYLMFTNVLF